MLNWSNRDLAQRDRVIIVFEMGVEQDSGVRARGEGRLELVEFVDDHLCEGAWRFTDEVVARLPADLLQDAGEIAGVRHPQWRGDRTVAAASRRAAVSPVAGPS